MGSQEWQTASKCKDGPHDHDVPKSVWRIVDPEVVPKCRVPSLEVEHVVIKENGEVLRNADVFEYHEVSVCVRVAVFVE